jgi:hypothetical protein
LPTILEVLFLLVQFCRMSGRKSFPSFTIQSFVMRENMSHLSHFTLAATLACISALPFRTAFGDELSGAEVRKAMIARVDELVEKRFSAFNIQPTRMTTDSEFVRRAYLDLTGVIPKVSQVRAFLQDDDPEKRSRLIDRLLVSPGHATHLATTWRNIMMPDGFDPQQINNVAGVQNWLRSQFVENMRYDRIVADFLVATGGGDSGPALFYTAQELKPEKLAASTARVFLNLKIDCAQCHDHPFDHWTQRDFWGYAAFFAQLQQPGEMPSPDVQLVDLGRGEVMLPDTDEIVPPRYPGAAIDVQGGRGSRRVQLAIWMASRDNPYLPRAAVNRIWAHLFGRGLVEPVDDLGEHNPPSHPQLFEELTDYFIRTGFDIRQMFGTLANTRAYQRSSAVGSANAPTEMFARMAVKPLTAEQLYDSISRALLRRANIATMGGPAGARLFDPQRQTFVAKMQAVNRAATDYEAGVPQALMMMNSREISAAANGLLTALNAPWLNNEQRIETLCLATLSRYPKNQEREVFVEYVQQGGESIDANQRLGDVLWALLNSAEFTMNH